jgi:hypothetical protein
LDIDGDFYNWVDKSWNPTLPVPDTSKVMFDKWSTSHYFYESVGHKDINKQDVPFAVGFTYGYTKCGAIWGGKSHDMTCAVVPIAISVPGEPGKTKKTIGLIEQGYNVSDAEMVTWFKNLEKGRRLMLGNFSIDPATNKVIEGTKFDDTIDIVARTIEFYPDIVQRFEEFSKTLDPSYISGPGLIVAVW